MRFLFKKLYVCTFLLLGIQIYIQGSCSSNVCGLHAIIIPRSQSVDAARELISWQQLINRSDQHSWYGVFSFTAEYQQSFRGERLMGCFFGEDASCGGTCDKNDCGMLTISGSQFPGRGAHDWLADYFGLPTDFKSLVSFFPRIQNVIFDFNFFYVDLDPCVHGLFFRLHAPLVWTKWDLRATESVMNLGQNIYSAGYMSAVANNQLQKSFLSATGGFHGTFGDVGEDFQYGIIGDSCANRCESKACFSDIELAVGWNFLWCDDYHLGLEIRGSAPAGNKPNARFLFEPIVGNGHYVTLGVGLTSHHMFWRNCDEDKAFGVWLDANFTHLFNNCQSRSFDIKNKPNSRYALVEKFTSPTVNLTAGTPPAIPDTQYLGTSNSLVHAINVTTFDVNTSFAVQVDLALKFGLQWGAWEFDLGYNFWARSSETICRLGKGLPANTYALKGDAFIYGFTGGTAVPLSATESFSDIHAGTNTPIGAIFDTSQFNNPRVDSAHLAFAGDGVTPLTGPDLVAQTRTSLQSILLSDDSIDYSGAPPALTNRIFAHINYLGVPCCEFTPFIGVGGSAEFATSICAISQWALWLKVGVAYN